MASLLDRVPRLTFLVMTGLVITAIMLGRWGSSPVPEPGTSERQPARPRYHAFSGFLFPQDRPHHTRLIDTETGEVTLLEVTGQEGFSAVACSPWRDGSGQFHLVGRRTGPQASDANISCEWAVGLTRCTYPGGRVLNRIAFDLVPASPPCWFPDRSDRILLAAYDGRLYDLTLPGAESRGSSVTALQPRPIPWKIRPPGKGPTFLKDPCWPAPEILGGRLLVSLRAQRPSSAPEKSRLQLWWLQLSPDGTAIVDAGRLIAPPRDRTDASGDERLASVGLSPDGVPMLAYVLLQEGRPPGELWIAPISFRSGGKKEGAPRVRMQDARRLCTTCTTAAPTFSADGRSVYAAVRTGRDGAVRVDRFCLAREESTEGFPHAPPLDSAQRSTPAAPPAPDNGHEQEQALEPTGTGRSSPLSSSTSTRSPPPRPASTPA